MKKEFITIEKGKIFNITLDFPYFSKNFFTEPHTYLFNTLCKFHDFPIFYFESGHIFQKMWLSGKIHFAIFFEQDRARLWYRETSAAFSCSLWGKTFLELFLDGCCFYGQETPVVIFIEPQINGIKSIFKIFFELFRSKAVYKRWRKWRKGLIVNF